MTFEETGKMMAMLTTYYTTRLMPQVNEISIEMWAKMLEDIPAEVANAAIAAWVATNKYPPTIADIREMSFRAATQQVDTAEEAWGKVIQALRKFGGYDKESALQMLGEPARKIVEQFTWRYYCEMLTADTSTYFAQFRNAYNAEVKKQKERLLIPGRVLQALESRQLLQLGDGEA